MTRFLLTVTRSVATVLVALVAFACTEEGPSAPGGDPAASVSPNFSAAPSGATPTDQHVVLLESRLPGDFADRVADLGGTLERSHPEIKIAVVSGLSDAAAAELGSSSDVEAIARDVMLQWIPSVEEMEWSVEALPSGVISQGHDPTTASFFPSQWDMRIIDADDAWNAGFSGSSSVRVAILDTGLDPFHQDLVGLIDAANSIAFTPSFNPNGPTWGDDRFHGTHVGGTVVTNGIGTSGVAPHTTLIAVKVLNVGGSGSFANIMSGIMHAANVGADVINMSLGVQGGIPRDIPGVGQLMAAVNKAVNFANRNGVLVVSSAGNSALDMDHTGNVVFTPCENGAGICISATGPTDALASYSNFGASAVNVAAPGGDFDGISAAASVVLSPCSTLSLVIPICQTGQFYLFLQGTSMAAPHVSGAAALLEAQSAGGLNAAQLKTKRQQTADDLGKRGTDPAFGKGRINVCNLVNC